MVYQDLALIDAADIATNLTLGREPVRRGPLGWLGVLDKKAMRREAARELEALGVTTAPVTRPVEMLSGGQRQVVALARSAVRTSARGNGVLLLDEPTAALGYAQTRQVEDLIKRMAGRGIAVVLVTHNLPLCFKVADRIAVLNRGRKVADVATGDTDNDSVVGWITGAKAAQPHLLGATHA
jgi:ABC-type sugar transport system ATPase subunit